MNAGQQVAAFVRAGMTEEQARAVGERHHPLDKGSLGWALGLPHGDVLVSQRGVDYAVDTAGQIRRFDGKPIAPQLELGADPNPTRARSFIACPACGDPTGVRCCEFGADR